MTFRATLDEHLCAIQSRDLDALIRTLPNDDDALVLIMADGRLVRSVREFVALHRDWFASTNWTLEAEPVSAFESDELGIATLRLDYREEAPDGRRVHVPPAT